MKRIYAVTLGCAALTGCSDYRAIHKAENAVAAQSVEPHSVQFRNVKAYPNMVCGQANGKDNTGSFRGFRPFSYDRNTGVTKVNFALAVEPARSADMPSTGSEPGCSSH